MAEAKVLIPEESVAPEAESLVRKESIAPETKGLDPRKIAALEESIAPKTEDPVPEEKVAPEVKVKVSIVDSRTPAPPATMVSRFIHETDPAIALACYYTR